MVFPFFSISGLWDNTSLYLIHNFENFVTPLLIYMWSNLEQEGKFMSHSCAQYREQELLVFALLFSVLRRKHQDSKQIS